MIAIHNSGEWSFRPEWVDYCENNNIPYKIVNAYSSDIIKDVQDCNVFLFHHHHTDSRDYNFAKQLLLSLEQSGKRVFPDSNTGWHFDDKLGQKYLLEAIKAPIVPTHAFYSKIEAEAFFNSTTLPEVFKLRGGAGSNNVKLLRTKRDVHVVVKKAFGSGFDNYDKWVDLKENLRRFKSRKASFKDLLKSVRRIFTSTDFGKTAGKERAYLLIQDFMPNNTSDIRVVVIGERAFAIKRPVRKNDFRASGSGLIVYETSEIDKRCIKISFEITEKLKAQSVAYDFVFDQTNNPLIVEVSYGFAHRAYDKCPGYWNRELNFIEKPIDPCSWMIEDILNIGIVDPIK